MNRARVDLCNRCINRSGGGSIPFHPRHWLLFSLAAIRRSQPSCRLHDPAHVPPERGVRCRR
jgi:hypothetical protein